MNVLSTSWVRKMNTAAWASLTDLTISIFERIFWKKLKCVCENPIQIQCTKQKAQNSKATLQFCFGPTFLFVHHKRLGNDSGWDCWYWAYHIISLSVVPTFVIFHHIHGLQALRRCIRFCCVLVQHLAPYGFNPWECIYVLSNANNRTTVMNGITPPPHVSQSGTAT